MKPDGDPGASERPARERARSSRGKSAKDRKVSGLLGVGLDNGDGHRRITKGDDFLLLGGSRETHERMTDIVLRMRERLKKSGRSFRQLSPREFEDLAGDSL